MTQVVKKPQIETMSVVSDDLKRKIDAAYEEVQKIIAGEPKEKALFSLFGATAMTGAALMEEALAGRKVPKDLIVSIMAGLVTVYEILDQNIQ